MKLSEFIEKYPQLLQQMYDILSIRIWFFNDSFSVEDHDPDISVNDDGKIDGIYFWAKKTQTIEDRENSIQALNVFFGSIGVKTSASPPSLYIGITKIYETEEECKSEWRITTILGEGVEGVSYSVCCEAACNSESTHVMKIENIYTEASGEQFIHEAELTKLFGINEIGPKVVSIYTGKYVGIIIMEKLTITLKGLEKYILSIADTNVAIRILHIIKDKFSIVISKLHKLGYVHKDIHGDNVMLKINMENLLENLETGRYELRLIDFGIMEKITGKKGMPSSDERIFDDWFKRLMKKVHEANLV